MAVINYNGKTVSDDEIKTVLRQIADLLGKDINVTSGDRNYVPPGGSPTSLHLSHRAVDFHLAGMDDGAAYQQIKINSYYIFSSSHGYEFIWHGDYTGTGGPHLHLGRFGAATPGYVRCIKEGITSTGKGVYSTEINISITWGREG